MHFQNVAFATYIVSAATTCFYFSIFPYYDLIMWLPKGPIVYYVPAGGGYNFKTSPFLGGKFFSGKKHEGGQILTQQQQSREFDVSDLSSIPWLGKRKEFVAISGPEERVV